MGGAAVLPESASARVTVLDPAAARSAPWEMLNRKPFLVDHALAGHPLFEIAQLARVAAAAVRRGDPNKYGVRFDSDPATRGEARDPAPSGSDLVQAVERIAGGAAWLKISSLQELDPRYEALRQSFVDQVAELTGLRLSDEISWSGISVFVASPNMITPYHFDHDVNFLFQIQGTKDVYLFDQNDRSVLTEEEIEDFYLGHPFAGILRDEIREMGTRYRLDPGTAVHQPPLAPHLVCNGDNVSVSVSIWFALRSLDARAKVFQANSCLRRLGFRPLAPGASPARDFWKRAALNLVSKPHPKTQRELLYSGINRISATVKLANRLMRRRAA